MMKCNSTEENEAKETHRTKRDFINKFNEQGKVAFLIYNNDFSGDLID